jgi:hypothetical protein
MPRAWSRYLSRLATSTEERMLTFRPSISPRGVPMRSLPSVLALSLLLMWSGANAQSDAQAKHSPQSSSKAVGSRALGQAPKDIHAQMNAWYEDCRHGWDAKTHMSKKDYQRTCRRMAHERVKFINDEAKRAGRAK